MKRFLFLTLQLNFFFAVEEVKSKEGNFSLVFLFLSLSNGTSERSGRTRSSRLTHTSASETTSNRLTDSLTTSKRYHRFIFVGVSWVAMFLQRLFYPILVLLFVSPCNCQQAALDSEEVLSALNIGLVALLAVHAVVFIGLLLAQKPWRSCCYPSAPKSTSPTSEAATSSIFG